MRSPQEEVMNALVLAKRERRPEHLVQMNSTDRNDLMRADYLRLEAAGGVLYLNLAIQHLSGQGEGKVCVYKSGAITAQYDAGTATTRVTVGELVVLSNELAGRERLNPGQWLFAITDAYRDALTREEAERRRESLRRAQMEIAELTAEI